MRYLLLLAILMVLSNCNSLTSISKKIDSIAKEHFKEEYLVRINSSETYALIVNKHEGTSPVAPIKYAIYDVKSDKIIFEEQKRGGSVEWRNDTYILVKSKPEVQSVHHEQNRKMAVYYINAITLEKVYELDNE